MTAKSKQRRETDNDEIQGSFDCVWRKSAPDSAQDDNYCWAALRMTAKNRDGQEPMKRA
jgi:hypothetical protein